MIRKVLDLINGWLSQPVQNAASRLGLFRIVYALFYLWHLSVFPSFVLDNYPAQFLRFNVGLRQLLPAVLPENFFAMTEAALIFLLSLLLLGWRVRLVTLLILIAGGILEVSHVEVAGEHARTFLTFFIPFFMFLCDGCWGHTYSVDAAIRKKRGTPVLPGSDYRLYHLPVRAIHVVLVLLFLTAVVFKAMPGATFLTRPHFLASVWMERSIFLIAYDLPYSPLNSTIYQMPRLDLTLRYFVFLIEALFCLSLLHWRFLRFFVSLLLVFHAVNGMWLGVTFTPILIVYLLFIDWERIKRKIVKGDILPGWILPSWPVAGAALTISALMGGIWFYSLAFRSFFNGFGMISWHTIWYPILPLAGGFLVYFLYDEVQRWRNRSSTLLKDGVNYGLNFLK